MVFGVQKPALRTEFLIIRELGLAPINALIEFRLHGDADGDQRGFLAWFFQPAVQHHGVEVSPAGFRWREFEVLAYPENVHVFVGPHIAATRYRADPIVLEK